MRGGEAVTSDGHCLVLRNTLAALKHEAQVELSVCKPLCRGKAVESHSLGKVLRNTPTQCVAPSNHKLPKAAARRHALPSQRKPSRLVLSNTTAPNVAEAEYALAVRTTQRRPR